MEAHSGHGIPIYCSAPTKQQALVDLQSIIQARFFTLKLVLNVEKTKFMWLSNSRNSLDGSVVKSSSLVSAYKYLGIIIDDKLRFDSYMNYLRLKLKKQLWFYFRNKSCFSFNARKKLCLGLFSRFLTMETWCISMPLIFLRLWKLCITVL